MFYENLRNIFLYNQHAPLIFTRLYFWGFLLVILTLYLIYYNNKKISGYITFFLIAGIFTFLQMSFWSVFALIIILNTIFYEKNALRNGYLFFISVFFYYKTGGLFYYILLFSTLSNFFIGLAIYYANKRLYKKLWVAFSVIINLGTLAFFKYDYFFTETINAIFHTKFDVITHSALWSNQLLGTHFDIGKILPPVGISFFTFQTMSYSFDLLREKTKPVKSITDFGFYVSFFPQLVAGPIVRAADFIPQLYNNFKLTKYEFGLALFFILKGLIKKMFIGDYVAVNLIDRVFANHMSYSGFENLMALYGYSLQVYCDFSGYTDIAIGIAALMGFKLPKNFNSPYKAKNCGDFWKRWHISLSSWLKDYLYIPMGGNRGGSLFTYLSLSTILIFVVLLAGKIWLAPLFAFIICLIWLLTRFFPELKLGISTNINLMMTMLLGGLWHGANWTFVMWGGLNGIGIVVYKFWRKISPYENSNHLLTNFWKIFITFNFITFTRIWFRGESWEGTMQLLKQVGTSFSGEMIPEMITAYWKVFLVMIFGFLTHWLPTKFKDKYKEKFIYSPLWLQVTICVIIVFFIYQSISADLQPFIYFQF